MKPVFLGQCVICSAGPSSGPSRVRAGNARHLSPCHSLSTPAQSWCENISPERENKVIKERPAGHRMHQVILLAEKNNTVVASHEEDLLPGFRSKILCVCFCASVCERMQHGVGWNWVRGRGEGQSENIKLRWHRLPLTAQREQNNISSAREVIYSPDGQKCQRVGERRRRKM